mgnify:FL=1
MEKHELWQAALAKLELDLSRPNFLTWFQETGILNVENGTVTIAVPNGFAKEWLQNKYHKAILHALRELASDTKGVNYIIGRVENASAHMALRDHGAKKRRVLPSPFDNDEFSFKELSVNPETNLNPRYTFENFVVGSFNELAHATAQSVINNLGVSYNPLFIYGGVGLGKTHLIQAIGNGVLKKNSGLKIKYVPSEKYMGEIVDAIKNQEMNKLKERYRLVDLLIIDDIQFIARTEKMQEEFFHTFNALYEKNKQIIISSDRPPQAIPTLEERLRSRFEGGMIADIGLPDLETRLTILKAKADSKKVVIPETVLLFIAENIKNNVRELEGALNRVVMASKLSSAPIDVDAVKKIISSQRANTTRFVSAKKIVKAVAEFYDIEEKELITQSRRRDIVKPRQIAMYIIREELHSSYPSIGERFGGRDHTTAIHSCEKIAQDLKTSPELEEEIRTIRDRIFTS